MKNNSSVGFACAVASLLSAIPIKWSHTLKAICWLLLIDNLTI